MVKKESLIVLIFVSMFLISACDVYETLYVKETEVEGGAVEVPEENITIEIGEIIEEIEVGVEEEVEIDEEGLVTIIEELEIDTEVEEEAEEEIPEEATVIIVKETDLVSLVPKAEDPDMDALTFTFTSPLDDNGEWQTTYGNAGEYTVTVTASDGKLTTSKEVLVIVNRKEEAPVLDSFKPEDTIKEIKETDTIEFEVTASDLNDDVLRYSWKLDGVEIGNRNCVEYKTTYEDAGSHTIKVIVSDGLFDTEKIWSVTVNNLNRKPLLKEIEDIEAKETDTIVIELEASDTDGDELSYEIDDGRFVQEENKFTLETTYDDSGEHLITVTVSDGVDTTSQKFKITIENVNRAPVLIDIVQKQ